MTDAIVHIGFNKCGSTALQAWLAKNIDALARSGFAYRRTDPRSDVICSNPQFFELAYHLADADRIPRREFAEIAGFDPWDKVARSSYLDAFTSDYDHWLSHQRDKTVIISNEWLGPYLGSTALISGFDTWLTKRFDNVRYLAYIRSPIAWTLSAWSQHRDAPGREEAALQDFIAADMPDLLTSFSRTLPAWETTIGRSRLDLRLFDEAWRKTGGLLADFMQACRIPATADLSTAPHVNASQPRSADRASAGADLDLLRSIHVANAPTMHWIGTTLFNDSQAFDLWRSDDQKYSLKEG
jgi:hypothetical protein